MRPLSFILVLFLLLSLFALPAGAEFCAQDTVPAATLLVPYFEVDLNDCNRTTEISVTNASSEATIAFVTLWSDLGVPVLDFHVYLTGYDVQTIDLGDVLCNGNVPVTGAGVSPHGSASGGPVAFPGCNSTSIPGEVPVYDNPAISFFFRWHLQSWLTGQQSPITGDCAGIDHGDNVARGYATIDVAEGCGFLFPSNPGYFDAYAGSENVLLGDYVLADRTAGTAGVFPAVHIEARHNYPANHHTFYGRYFDADGSDAREALPSTFAARFRSDDANGFTSTRLLAWREGDGSDAGFACGTETVLPQASAFFFDEEENVTAAQIDLPGQTNLYDVTGDVANPYDNGWAVIDLRHDGIAYDDDLAQGWVTTAASQGAGFQGGTDAAQLDRVCAKE